MRLDRLLVNLRFVRTRSQARSLIEEGHMRINSVRVSKSSRLVCPGDVVTLFVDGEVTVAKISTLPDRRLPPAEAARSWHKLS